MPLSSLPLWPHNSRKARPSLLPRKVSKFDNPKAGMARAYLTGDCTMKKLTGHLGGGHDATGSRAVKRGEQGG